MKNPRSPKSPRPAKIEALTLGSWLPIARVVRFTCCRCKLHHTHTYRVRNGKVEVRITA